MQRQLDEDKNDEHFMDQMQNECKYKAYDKNVLNSLKHKDYMCKVMQAIKILNICWQGWYA